MGYLYAQALRAARVVVDIGMHLELEVPQDQHGLPPFAPGRRWTPELAGASSAEHTGWGRRSSTPRSCATSAGRAGHQLQARRARVAGRPRGRPRPARREGRELDLKAWHMAALGTGALGLDDLARELAALG